VIKGNSKDNFHKRIGDADVIAIVAAFTQLGCGSVHTLDLSWNDITDKGCGAIAELLRSNATVLFRAADPNREAIQWLRGCAECLLCAAALTTGGAPVSSARTT